MTSIDDILRGLLDTPAYELDEHLYAIAAGELRGGAASPGLLAQAFAQSGGDERQAEVQYLELRVTQLRHRYRALAAQRKAHRKKLEDRQKWERRKAETERRMAERSTPQARRDRNTGCAVLFLVVVVAGVLAWWFWLVTASA